jgi:hypothetical protein
MNKEIIKIVIKVVIYTLGLIATYLGVTSLTSCTTSHSVSSRGTTTIISVDTTFVNHGGFIRSKNYLPYE